MAPMVAAVPKQLAPCSGWLEKLGMQDRKVPCTGSRWITLRAAPQLSIELGYIEYLRLYHYQT